MGVSILSIALATGAGCATIAGGHGGRRDVHASTHVAGVGARVLVTGPALLMHVDVEGRDDLVLYAVARKDGTEADCAAEQTSERKRIRPGVPNLVNLPVAAGQTICIAAAPDTAPPRSCGTRGGSRAGPSSGGARRWRSTRPGGRARLR